MRNDPRIDPQSQLSALRDPAFVDRHIGPAVADQDTMLSYLGFDSMDTLVDEVVPPHIRTKRPLEVAGPLSESDALAELATLASENEVMTSMIGLGYHRSHIPAVILRNIMENPAWYTAYTPYQPEISQGRLEALVNFQTMVSDLTGMEIANASLLDEATAAGEAMTMARRVSKKKTAKFFVDSMCHPHTLGVIRTRATPLGIEIVEDRPSLVDSWDEYFGVLLAYPATDGSISDYRQLAADASESGTIVAVVADLLALCLLEAPGTWGADIAIGSAQRFGVPMGFGGPHAGFMATKEKHKRSLPGRLVGVSVDSQGNPAYRLALQTREQHIRRDKATSNICTAQVLLAVMSAMYGSYHGPDGLRSIATKVSELTDSLAERLKGLGFEIRNETWFDTLSVSSGGKTDELVEALRVRGINIRNVDSNTVGVSLDETTTLEQVDSVVAGFEEFGSTVDHTPGEPVSAGKPIESGLPTALLRTTAFMTHENFSNYRSETAMLRYLRRLSDKDLALDRSMIPLGSCTMKLNATTEMIPVTWSEFADIHPFAPESQTTGYRALISQLEDWLADICGYDAASLQPNAGSQGELAGLLAISAYHQSRGEGHRNVCLIPSSAHGTNAASAVMAGMAVVVVACDDSGNIDMDDLEAKIETHRENLAGVMVTYPSTHGVFEEAITALCASVHNAGGQVYLDGANMNAMVGLARPGEFGADVSHLNLHKTFCIPHGGGGPGVGPVLVREHLSKFLPSHELGQLGLDGSGVGQISAAPYGSASILPISWAYIAMMGPDGLRAATASAILSANYVAKRLSDSYPVLYSGRGGLVAHECIIDIRPIERDTGVSAEDIAKRLIDYGFHAPTMSFPVAGTLMIEPTESEDLFELDRFCDAMIQIRSEIQAIAEGEYTVDGSPLRNAPHTAEMLTADAWDQSYGRTLAGYPVASLYRQKYWSPVGRVDNGYGDRNLQCSCPPPEAFE